MTARRLGCNPGGQVEGVGPIDLAWPVPAEWTNRLLTRAECEGFDRLMGVKN
jgi:hypothetical protein